MATAIRAQVNTGAWWEEVALTKAADSAGEAAAQDAAVLGGYGPVQQEKPIKVNTLLVGLAISYTALGEVGFALSVPAQILVSAKAGTDQVTRVCHLAYYTGLRVDAVVALAVAHVRLSARRDDQARAVEYLTVDWWAAVMEIRHGVDTPPRRGQECPSSSGFSFSCRAAASAGCSCGMPCGAFRTRTRCALVLAEVFRDRAPTLRGRCCG